MSHELLVNQIIEAGRRLDERGLVAGTEGNLSARTPEGTVLVTASGRFKGRLLPADIVEVNLDGELVRGDAPLTSEAQAHLACYRLRRDVGAVVHAHPPYAVALMLAGAELGSVPLAEAAYALGHVPTSPFALPGTCEGGDAVAEHIERHDAILLDRHGAVTVGADPMDALARMEMLDAVAKMVVTAGGPENLRQLERDQVERIAQAALAAGSTLASAVEMWRDTLLERTKPRPLGFSG